MLSIILIGLILVVLIALKDTGLDKVLQNLAVSALCYLVILTFIVMTFSGAIWDRYTGKNV